MPGSDLEQALGTLGQVAENAGKMLTSLSSKLRKVTTALYLYGPPITARTHFSSRTPAHLPPSAWPDLPDEQAQRAHLQPGHSSDPEREEYP